MSEGALNTVRSQKWDILKFFLIFTVVLGHAADNYTSSHEHMRSLFFFIYIFHMPLFIFVSGLFSNNTVKNKRFDKMAGYLVVYVFLKIYVYLVKYLAGNNPDFDLFSEGGAPWFMLALFFFNLITIAVRKLPWKAVLSVSIVIACVIGYFSEVKDFLALSRVFNYYPFFYLGYIADRKRIEEFCKGKREKIVAAIILAVTAVIVFVSGDGIYWLRYLLTGRNPYATSLGAKNNLEDLPEAFETFGFAFRLGYFAVVAVVCFCIIILIPDRTPFGICSKLGQRTLAVYGLHFGALYLIFDILKLKPVFADLLGQYNEWIIIPISVIVTLFFSIRYFNDAMTFIMNIPCNITEKIKSR